MATITTINWQHLLKIKRSFTLGLNRKTALRKNLKPLQQSPEAYWITRSFYFNNSTTKYLCISNNKWVHSQRSILVQTSIAFINSICSNNNKLIKQMKLGSLWLPIVERNLYSHLLVPRPQDQMLPSSYKMKNKATALSKIIP